MAAIRQRGTRDAESSSDDDADILARAQHLASSPPKPVAADQRRRTTQLNAPVAAAAPQAGCTSSDSDADLLLRAQQKPRPPAAQVGLLCDLDIPQLEHRCESILLYITSQRSHFCDLQATVAPPPARRQTAAFANAPILARRTTDGPAAQLPAGKLQNGITTVAQRGIASVKRNTAPAQAQPGDSDSDEDWSRMLARGQGQSSSAKQPPAVGRPAAAGQARATAGAALAPRASFRNFQQPQQLPRAPQPRAAEAESSDDDWVQAALHSKRCPIDPLCLI